MLGILWWLCKLGLLITFGIPFIIIGIYILVVCVFSGIQLILYILEKLYEIMGNGR